MIKKLFKILRGFTFLLILAILMVIVTNIFVPTYVQWRWDSDSTTNSFYELEKNTVDVLVVGPSVSAAAINPMELYKEEGICSYNLSIIHEPMMGTYYWLKEACETQKPKLVVLEIQIGARKNPKKEERFRLCYDYMRFGKNKIEMAQDYCEYDDEANIVEYLFPMAMFHDRWKEFTELNYIENKSSTRGFNALVRTYKKGFDGTDMSSKDMPEQYSEIDYEYLEKTIKFCQEQKMEVLLLRTPDPTWTVEKHNVIEKCAEKYDVSFLDCNEKGIFEKIGIDWKVDGNDSQHLNYHGASKFTKYLGEYLSANYELEDHRGGKEEEKLGYDFEGYKKYMDHSKELEKQIKAGKQLWKE